MDLFTLFTQEMWNNLYRSSTLPKSFVSKELAVKNSTISILGMPHATDVFYSDIIKIFAQFSPFIIIWANFIYNDRDVCIAKYLDT